MNLLFANMLNEFTMVYLNDILVYSETQKEYLVYLKKGLLKDQKL